MITTQELIDKVAFLVNEPGNDSAITLLSEDTRSLSDTIYELLPDAVMSVQNSKHSGTLNPKIYTVGEGSVTDNGDGSVTVVLPNDFVNLIELRFKGWERPCTTVEPPASPLAHAQSNVHTRGGCCKPVCVEGVNNAGARVVNCYSLPTGVAPAMESFVYEALFDPREGLSCPQWGPLVWAVVYQCAALLYNVFEKYNAANSFMAIAASWCKNGKTE